MQSQLALPAVQPLAAPQDPGRAAFVAACRDAGVRPATFGAWCDGHERDAQLRLEACPQLWVDFVRAALARIRGGWTHGSAKQICEGIRWDHERSYGPGADGYHLNNSHVTPMARAFARAYPSHASWFRFRGGAA